MSYDSIDDFEFVPDETPNKDAAPEEPINVANPAPSSAVRIDARSGVNRALTRQQQELPDTNAMGVRRIAIKTDHFGTSGGSGRRTGGSSAPPKTPNCTPPPVTTTPKPAPTPTVSIQSKPK